MWGSVGASGMHSKGPTEGSRGGQGTRRAHLKHPGHVRDAGRVEAQRLVERRRVLPSQKGGMRRGVRWRGATAAQAACTRMARLKAAGARARAERTSNM